MSINLQKQQTVSLQKQSGAATLTKLQMGLGWDAKKGFLGFGGGDIDLDASCVMFAGTNVVDTVWFRQLRSQDGSITHSGDNRTGEGDGDDEVIYVDLARLPANVSHLVFTVNSFTGQTFAKVKNAYCRITDNAGKELARYDLSDAATGSHTGMIMVKVSRQDNDWSCTALGVALNGRTWEEMQAAMMRVL